jgi:hypothetical protein
MPGRFPDEAKCQMKCHMLNYIQKQPRDKSLPHRARVHQTLRVTRAMQAGIANHIWSLEEIVGLMA